jgi:hypothetical protein
MKHFLRAGLAIALAASMPMTALAQQHGAPPLRQAAPPPRPIGPPPAPRPAYLPAPHTMAPPRPIPQAGFSFPHDPTAHPAPNYPAHPIAPPAARPMPPGSRPIAPPPGRPVAYRPPPPLPPNYRGPVVSNPNHWGHYGWNRGRVWYPAPIYWGGGFWGPFGLGALSGTLLYGSIVDYQDQQIYPSYQIQPLTPGAQLLQNYGLTQTPCGPPNLVVIWGPGDSVICAFPSDLVSAGNYQLDPTTLTLVSAPPPQQ